MGLAGMTRRIGQSLGMNAMKDGTSFLQTQASSESRSIDALAVVGSGVTEKPEPSVAAETIDAGYLAFERRFQRTQMWDVVSEAIDKALEERNWSRKDIARRLGKDPAVISRWLSSPSNWQIDTIAELLCAIDAEPRLSVSFHGESCLAVRAASGTNQTFVTKDLVKQNTCSPKINLSEYATQETIWFSKSNQSKSAFVFQPNQVSTNEES